MPSRCSALARLSAVRLVAAVALALLPVLNLAQPASLGEGPWYYETEHMDIKVSVLARGIRNPWGMVFLPSGNILIAEKPGAFHIIRNGVLDPDPRPVRRFRPAGSQLRGRHPGGEHLYYR